MVHVGGHADKGGTIGTNVILVGAELATLSSDALELLLSWGIGIANVHEKTLFTNTEAVELADDFVTDIAVLESGSS